MVLESFDVVISEEGNKYTVRYVKEDFSGVCIYEKVEKMGVNKPIRQTILILTHSEMEGVLNYWNLKSPLDETKLDEVTNRIRNHSRQMVEEYLQGQSL